MEKYLRDIPFSLDIIMSKENVDQLFGNFLNLNNIMIRITCLSDSDKKSITFLY